MCLRVLLPAAEEEEAAAATATAATATAATATAIADVIAGAGEWGLGFADVC